jgi:hypothetical protein
VEGVPEHASFLSLHAAWFALCVLCGVFLYRRPRPKVALAVLMLMHTGAFLGYYRGLPRTYAVGVSSDRALGVGMALAVANGGSPFNHVQVAFGNLEPFWTFTVAALSRFSFGWVPFVYDHMAILVLVLTALGFYRGWSDAEPGEDPDRASWRGVYVAAAVLGLSSITLSETPPIHQFWHGNFVFKPNHALAFGLVGLLSRWRSARSSWVTLGFVQALLIWAFILDWAYLLPGLFFAALLDEDRIKAVKRVVLGTVLGLILGLPYLVHLLRDYSPVGKGEMPEIWRDQMGPRLTNPYWWSLDLGPLLILFAVGLGLALRRSSSERAGLGFLLTGPLVTLTYVIGLRFAFAPEPDEGYYYSRLALAAGAGYALWTVAWRGEGQGSKRLGAGFAIVLACSFPGYFDPVRDDRYYDPSRSPLPAPVVAVANWITNNTPADAVMISSEGIMLSGLTGRRFLMVRPGQTADRAARERMERDMLTSLDEVTVRRAAAGYGVTYVIVDSGLRERYGDEVRGLGNRQWFEPLFANSFARILRLRPQA